MSEAQVQLTHSVTAVHLRKKRCTSLRLCHRARLQTQRPSQRHCCTITRAEKNAGKVEETAKKIEKTADEITEKYGLEAGLWKVFRSKDGNGQSRGTQAKDLLKRYGSAYLITSITFAIISFSLCYALVSAGVDVASLLSRIGLSVSDTNEKVGTVAIAYAAHKALSPVRFPPTVALTPVVAKLLGKDTGSKSEGSEPK